MSKMNNFIKNIIVLLKTTFDDYKQNKKHLKFYTTDSKEKQFATLRMFCHMMDKALNNPLFEPGHSQEIYNEALKISEKIKDYYFNDPSFIWTQNILKNFNEIQKKKEVVKKNNKTVVYTDNEKTLIKKFILSRTSCRNFQKKYISEDIIKDIISLAIDAPNGCCRQAVRFYITQKASKITNLIPNIAGITNFTNIQGLVAVCAESSFYSLKDKKLQYVDASLSSENFILAASMHGVYGTMCNFFHASPKQINNCKKILSIKDSENIVMFIAIGYPINIPQKPTRQDISVFYKDV